MLFPSDPLDQLREGMDVVDTAGKPLGRIARIQPRPAENDLLDEMLDVTPSPPTMTGGPGLEVIGVSPFGDDAAGLGDLPEGAREHFLRVGFIEVDGPDLHGAARFIAADHIEGVAGDRVTVRATANQ